MLLIVCPGAAGSMTIVDRMVHPGLIFLSLTLRVIIDNGFGFY